MKIIRKAQSMHLCVDMQKLFAESTPWSTPWAYKILPQIILLIEFDPSKTIFTRFIPVKKSNEGIGMWKKYYERWECMTRENIHPTLLELISELSQFIPPAIVVDKHVYGPWIDTSLHQFLQSKGINTLIISGGETDILSLSVSPWEIIVRGSLLYWFLFTIFRFLLRRDIGSMQVGDILFVVIVADAAQNAMSADATNIADGMLLVSTLVFWNLILDYLSFRFSWFRKFAVAPSILLVKDGILQSRNMRREFITKDELLAKIREEGIDEISTVKEIRLESDGEISIVKKDNIANN